MRLAHGAEGWDVTVRDTGGAVEVEVDGRRFTVALEEAGPGDYVLRDGPHAARFRCVRDGDAVYVWWEGESYRLVEEREAEGALHRHVASGGLEAPMPGKVIKIAVAVGDAVTKGQELLVVEAMKMENGLRAPRDGVVKTIAARVGEMVSPGVVLVELE